MNDSIPDPRARRSLRRSAGSFVGTVLLGAVAGFAAALLWPRRWK